MPKRKRKATATQLRNLAKGRAKLKAMRRAGMVPARRRRPTRRNPCVPAAHRNPCAARYHRRKNPDVSHEAWELILYAQSSGDLQPQRDAIIKNVIRKINRGAYDASKAPRLWQYWIDSAAQDYTREFDTPIPGQRTSYGVFTRPIRLEAATYIAPIYFDEIKSGEYSHLLAFKKKTAKKRATKRNPAFGNFMDARNVLKTGRATNPVKKSGVYVLMTRSGKTDKYYDGVFFGPKTNAAHWTSIPVVKRIAQSVSDATGKSISILDVSKK